MNDGWERGRRRWIAPFRGRDNPGRSGGRRRERWRRGAARKFMIVRVPKKRVESGDPNQTAIGRTTS